MVTSVRSIDALLSGVPEAQPIDPSLSPVNNNTPSTNDDASYNEPPAEPAAPIESESEPEPEQQQAQSEAQDEYGNNVKKPRIYTEEEVNKMMRERFNRSEFKRMEEKLQALQQQQQPAQKPDSFSYDSESSDSWEVQLENFIKNTIVKINTGNEEQKRQEHEARISAEFESKMFEGMARLPDFVEVVSNQPISDNMVKAVRGLDNPAAFLYAAAKNTPKELERISAISDPYIQASEMGKLHERLSKRKASSSAPRPLSRDSSDIVDKRPAKVSIDHLIQQDALSRYKR